MPHSGHSPTPPADQQDLQSLHRARDRLICQRTALINHTRSLLAEYGIVLPQGPSRFTARAPAAIAGVDLSDLARTIFGELLDQLDDLDRRVKKLDATIAGLCRTNETCRRLAKLPGVGPVVATAIVAAEMAVSFARAARWQPGSGWCPGSIQLAANRGSAALDDAQTTISGAS